MADKTFMQLSDLFDWDDYQDTLGLYPFEAKCIAATFYPEKYPELIQLGKPTVDFLFGRSSFLSRQIKHGKIVLYFPERWLSAKEKPHLMQALYDLHDDYPVEYVHVITGEPLIVTDFANTMVRLWKDE